MTTTFDYKKDAPLKSITVHASAAVDAIQLKYIDGTTTDMWGPPNPGGKRGIFTLNDGEYVVAIYMWKGTHLDAIRFITNLGRWSPIFGSQAENPRLFGLRFGTSPEGGKPLIGIRGGWSWSPAFQANVIEWLEPYFSDKPSLQLRHIIESPEPAAGIQEGRPFDQLANMNFKNPFNCALKGVECRKINNSPLSSCFRCILSVKSGPKEEEEEFFTSWSSDCVPGEGSFDKFGYTTETIRLEAGEEITRVNICASDIINGIFFDTTHNRSNLGFGNQNGDAVVFEAPVHSTDGADDPTPMSLLCFEGRRREGELQEIWAMTSIRPYWIASSPIESTLQITSVDTSQGQISEEATPLQLAVHISNQTSSATKYTYSYTYTKRTSRTISLSDECRTKIGGSTTFGVESSATAKGGVPGVAEGEATVGASFSISLEFEKEWALNHTEGQEVAKEEAMSQTFEVKTEAHKEAEVTATIMKRHYTAVPWQGFMHMKYKNGKTIKKAVNGTFAGLDTSEASYAGKDADLVMKK